jgi:hypothetical protein
MTQEIAFQEGAIEVDARLIAQGLGLDVASLQELMRASKITSLCERGIDNELGQCRLTFFYGTRGLRFIVGEAGNVISQTSIDRDNPPLARPEHKPRT